MGYVGFFSVVGKFLISTKISTYRIWGEPIKFWLENSGWHSTCELHASGWIYLSLCTENKSSNSINTTNRETGWFAHSRFSSLFRSSQKNLAFGRNILLWPVKCFMQISRLNQGRMPTFNRETTTCIYKLFILFPIPALMTTYSQPQPSAHSIHLRYCLHNANNPQLQITLITCQTHFSSRRLYPRLGQ